MDDALEQYKQTFDIYFKDEKINKLASEYVKEGVDKYTGEIIEEIKDKEGLFSKEENNSNENDEIPYV